MDKLATYRIVTCSNKSNKPYFTSEIRNQKRLRSKLESRWRKNKTAAKISVYKAQAKLVAKLLQKSKREYYRNSLISNSTNPRKVWSLLNDITCHKLSDTLPSSVSDISLADKFFEFFTEKIKKLFSSFSHLSASDPAINATPNIAPPMLEVFKPATEDEVWKTILAASDATCSLDIMPTKYLKQCLPALVRPITNIVNT